jgi:hypothetical protein
MGTLTIKWKIKGSEVEYISDRSFLSEDFNKVCLENGNPNSVLTILDPFYEANPSELSFSKAPKLPNL